MKPRLLDLFCGAGGCSEGYRCAGFDVYGIDIKPQPHYPFPFLLMDAMEAMNRLLRGEGLTFSNGETLYLSDFDAYHASPPCQAYSEATPITHKDSHPKLIPIVRELLRATNLPYIIENVAGSRRDLITPVMICGSMFGLPLWRHRYFELSQFWMLSPMKCNHERRPMVVVGAGSNARKGRRIITPVLVTGTTSRRDNIDMEYSTAACKQAMEIDWMIRKELD